MLIQAKWVRVPVDANQPYVSHGAESAIAGGAANGAVKANVVVLIAGKGAEIAAQLAADRTASVPVVVALGGGGAGETGLQLMIVGIAHVGAQAPTAADEMVEGAAHDVGVGAGKKSRAGGDVVHVGNLRTGARPQLVGELGAAAGADLTGDSIQRIGGTENDKLGPAALYQVAAAVNAS